MPLLFCEFKKLS